MTPEELDEAMGVLGLNAQRLALRIGVTDRTVRRWLEGTRKIPPPVERLVNLLVNHPATRALASPEKTETVLVDPEQFERLRKEFYPDEDDAISP